MLLHSLDFIQQCQVNHFEFNFETLHIKQPPLRRSINPLISAPTPTLRVAPTYHNTKPRKSNTLRKPRSIEIKISITSWVNGYHSWHKENIEKDDGICFFSVLGVGFSI